MRPALTIVSLYTLSIVLQTNSEMVMSEKLQVNFQNKMIVTNLQSNKFLLITSAVHYNISFSMKK